MLGCVHFWWLVKKDITEPLIYAVIPPRCWACAWWREQERRKQLAGAYLPQPRSGQGDQDLRQGQGHHDLRPRIILRAEALTDRRRPELRAAQAFGRIADLGRKALTTASSVSM
jgi:hypothetical protein